MVWRGWSGAIWWRAILWINYWLSRYKFSGWSRNCFWGLGILAGLRHGARVRWLLIVLFCVGGCKKPGDDSVPTMPVPSPKTIKAWEPTEAQPKLPSIKLFVGGVELTAEQCRTERQI